MDSQEIYDFIEANYEEMTDEELAEACGKSIQAIRNRKTRLGIEDHHTKVAREKERLLKKQRKQAEAKRVRKEAEFSMLMDTLRTAITPLDFDPPEYELPESTEDPEEACLILSDLHFGKKIKGEYDLKVAKSRIEDIVKGFLKIIRLHREIYPIKKLHIFWCGDIVDGEEIYASQAHYTDGHMVNQIFALMPRVVELLALLASAFEEVENHCVRGNHGRTRKSAHEESNWDNIFYRTMEIATSKIDNMTWDIPIDWRNVVDVNGTKILQVHGDQIRQWQNRP